MTFWIKLTLIFALTFSFACSQRKAALIVNHSQITYGKNNKDNKEKYRDLARKTATDKSIQSREPGQKIIEGTTVGKIGNTGLSTGTHLHFEIMNNKTKINPSIIMAMSKNVQ
jgi:hypothetical protein